MLFALLDTRVTGVCIDGVFFSMQQLSNLRDIGPIGGCAIDVMNQAGFDIDANVRLHPEEILVTFLGLMHLGIALAFFILGRAGRMNNGGIDDGALAQRQATVTQITINYAEHSGRQLVLFSRRDGNGECGLIWSALQTQARKLTQGVRLIQRLFHCQMAVTEPGLHQMNTQHRHQWLGWTATDNRAQSARLYPSRTPPDLSRTGTVLSKLVCACLRTRCRQGFLFIIEKLAIDVR